MINYNNTPYGYNPQQMPYNFQPQNNLNRQPQMYNQSAARGYNLIAVNNKEEVNSIIADLNGAPVFIYNSADNEFYIKRFDAATASTIFNEYKKISPLAQPKNEKKYGDDIKTYDEKFQALNDKIDCLKLIIEKSLGLSEMKAGKNDK